MWCIIWSTCETFMGSGDVPRHRDPQDVPRHRDGQQLNEYSLVTYDIHIAIHLPPQTFARDLKAMIFRICR